MKNSDARAENRAEEWLKTQRYSEAQGWDFDAADLAELVKAVRAEALEEAAKRLEQDTNTDKDVLLTARKIRALKEIK